MLIYHTRDHLQSNFLMTVATGFLFVGFFDILHMLAYEEMNVFIGYSSDLPTQLWLMSRFFQLSSIYIAFIFSKKELNVKLGIGIYTLISILFLVSSLGLKIFPRCFVEGSGLTPFTIVVETIYVIGFSVMLLIFILNKDNQINPIVRKNFIGYLVLTILSEIALTQFDEQTGIINYIGHIFKFLAMSFLYILVKDFAIKDPVNAIFNKLEKRNKQLEISNNNLQTALGQIERFKENISVCSWCNNVEDATGKWVTTDSFLDNYATASHGVCDKCFNKLTKDSNE